MVSLEYLSSLLEPLKVGLHKDSREESERSKEVGTKILDDHEHDSVE